MVVAKNTAEDSKVAKAFQKSKNRLETKHFKTISGGGGKKASKGGRYLHPPTRTELFDTQRTKQYTIAPVSHAF